MPCANRPTRLVRLWFPGTEEDVGVLRGQELSEVTQLVTARLEFEPRAI